MWSATAFNISAFLLFHHSFSTYNRANYQADITTMAANPFSTATADTPDYIPTPPSQTSTPERQSFSMSSNSIPGPKLRRKKNVKKGIQFCLMVCGASGTGRTTFVNTLCQKSVLPHLDSDDPPYLSDGETTGEPSVKIKPVTVELELDEEGTRVSLTIVDTPGFGDSVDNEASFGEISSYLERQYDDILAEESRIKRNPRFRDNRVHVLLYFVQPTGKKISIVTSPWCLSIVACMLTPSRPRSPRTGHRAHAPPLSTCQRYSRHRQG